MITKRVQYRYDSVRNKIGMTDADGGLHTYTYDVMRRLTGVINPQGERTTYAYDLNGRRTSVQLANGTRTSYVYDVASRVQSVHTLKSDDSTVSKFEYEYDGNGRRTSVLEADGSRVTWTYDRISQVTAEWRTGTNPYRHTFTYDSVGNRTLKIEDGARTTLVYDACNQLLTSEDNSGTTTFTYDGNGNQTVIQKPSGDRTTQVWDYENRLVKTIQPSGGVTSMAYDADGLRMKLEEPTGTKLFVWDDQNYLAETDAAGTTETAFTTEPSTYGGLISHRKAGASTTYHFDALGSTRALTDESEAVQERYNYTAFGTLLGSPTLLTPFLWGGMVGYYWDAALATQYIRARHYQPTIARWISLDPIGFAGGDANLFRYVGNSPTSGGTGRRVRLTASAYGQWQLAIARSVLGHLNLAPMHESKGRFLSQDPIMFPNGANTYAGWFAGKGTDPSGLVGGIPNWPVSPNTGGVGYPYQFCYQPKPPTPKRTAGQCCTDAKKSNGMQRPDAEALYKLRPSEAGGVLCCDGQKIKCFYSIPVDKNGDQLVTIPEAIAIYRDCVLEHEASHFPETGPCNPDFPLYPAGVPAGTGNASECRAWKVSITCLIKGKEKCETLSCEQQIQDSLSRAYAIRRSYCRKAGLPEE